MTKKQDPNLGRFIAQPGDFTPVKSEDSGKKKPDLPRKKKSLPQS